VEHAGENIEDFFSLRDRLKKLGPKRQKRKKVETTPAKAGFRDCIKGIMAL
jgi:hypothetical protein